ncbi:MerR family transcriptional regulator [Streptomyces sp. NPDC058401]|uniref:MerR family transcriptional regulator n=1 Tax=Streptomyces sp. NPDC058401 TaxID=3346480 RepID=UPI00365D17D1
MRIGDAAAAAGTTPRALRFYEQRGLLAPQGRSPSGQREYGPGDVTRIRIIRDLLAHGFTVEDLRGVADRLHLLAADPPPTCGSGGGVVEHRLSALDAEIARLTRLRNALAHRTGLATSTDTGTGTGTDGPGTAAKPAPDVGSKPDTEPEPDTGTEPEAGAEPVPGGRGGSGKAGRSSVGAVRGAGGTRTHTLDRS